LSKNKLNEGAKELSLNPVETHGDVRDQDLIADFLAGSGGAFDQLVLKYQNQVFNLCNRMLGNTADAADCAQETFIKVYYGLKGFQFKSSFPTWLYRVAVNTCKNKFASAEYRRRDKTLSLSAPKPESDSPLEISDISSSPAEVYEKKETTELIMEAIAALPQEQRILIILCDLEEKSYQEIVEITGFRLGTVKSKLARARHLLRGKLEGAL
jgi:RNA polymerase sigma-70 factor (ECF subfamily)